MNTISFQPMMESRPIREIAYEVLKHAIITSEIPAGERIDRYTRCRMHCRSCAAKNTFMNSVFRRDTKHHNKQEYPKHADY